MKPNRLTLLVPNSLSIGVMDPTKPLTAQKVRFLDLRDLAALPLRKPPREERRDLVSRPRFAAQAHIHLLRRRNPHREGTHAWKQFELYRRCDTVREFVKKGGDRGYLNSDARKGIIKVA